MRGRNRESNQTPLDWVVEALMAAALVFLPLAYGTTQPWSQEIYFILVAAMGLCTLLRAIVYGDRLVRTWAYVPIGLFIGLVLLQLVPLPRAVLNAVSPHTLGLKDEFLAGLTTSAKPTLTFYALATERQLRLVLSVATIFAVVVQTYRTPERRFRLLTTAAAAGLAVALLAAYQDLTRAEMIYGVVPVGHKNAGPFQNYSHFSQFMNLSVGAALAWLLSSLAGWSNGWRDAAAAREQVQMAEHAFVWPAAALVIGGPLLVFASMSRMGMISMLAAGAITAGLLGWRGQPSSGRRRRGTGPAPRRGASLFYVATFAIAAVALVSIFGFDWVYDRLGTLQTQQATAIGTRQNLIRDLVPLWKQFPLFGTGLGTHEFVFPLFNRQPVTIIFTHAENEYAQLMEETGAAGVAIALAFVAMIAAAFVRVTGSPKRPEQYAAFGLGFGLIAILIHSASDFGQHVPADATLTAVFCGLLICLVRADAPPDRAADTSRSLPALSFKCAATAAFAGVFGLVVFFAAAESKAAAHFGEAQDAMTDIAAGRAADDDFVRLTADTAIAREAVPGDIAYAYWADVARWQKLVRETTDPATGQARLTAGHVDEIRQIVADLDAARILCPTYGPPLGLAGQLRARMLGDPAGDDEIVTAYRLTPHDPALCQLAGMLAVRQKRWDDATTILDRYVRLGGAMWQVVDAFCAANRPDLAQAAAATDWRNLRRLGDGLTAGWPKEQLRAAECHRQSDRLLVEASEAVEATADVCFERALLDERNGHAADATLWYQKAIEKDYDRPDWHLALAKAFIAGGRPDDAERELRVCLRQRPGWGEAEQLLIRRGRPPSTASGR